MDDLLRFKDQGLTNKYWEEWMVKERGNVKDNLHRTAMFFVAYGHSAFLSGIEKCIEKRSDEMVKLWNAPNKKYDNSKINNIDRNTSCRVAWALKIRNEQGLIDIISKKYSGNDSKIDDLTSADVFWLKSLSSKFSIFKAFQLHLILWFLSTPFLFFMDEKSFLTRCMQLSVCRKSILNKVLCKIHLLKADKNNLLSTILLGHNVDDRLINEIEPRTGFQFDLKYNDFYQHEPVCRKLTADEKKYNELDKYLILSVKQLLNKS